MSRWFRHYAGMARDDKLVRAAIKSGQTVERVVWVWAAILESAAEIDDGGRYDLDAAEAAYFLRAVPDDVDAVIAALVACGRLADGRVVKWGDRQFQSDRSAERQKRHRDKQKAARDASSERHNEHMERDSDDGVTAMSRHGDAPETETETETEAETEERNNNNPPSQASGGGGEIASEIVESQAGPEPKGGDEIPASLDRRVYPEAFETLWSVYRPVASKNATKADAHLAWKVLPLAERGACLDGLRRYVAWLGEEKQRRDGTKVKHLATFIEKRGWEPFLEPASAKPTPPPEEGPAIWMTWVSEDDPLWPTAAARHLSEKGKALFPTTSKHASGFGAFVPSDWIEKAAA